MTHGMMSVLARENGVDLLHIKGHAAPEDFYREGRPSSDADVLVRPHQASEFVRVLNNNGWKTVTSFNSGSIFQHAAALWHKTWGYVDVHRSFPGFSIPDEIAFEALWSSRNSKTIANQPCYVPDRLDHALIILVHSSRDPSRGRTDADFVINALSKNLTNLNQRVQEFGAHTPYAIATAQTGGVESVKENSDYRLWSALAHGDDRLELLKGRLEAADGLLAKAKVLLGSFIVNRDHLEMRLERSPKLQDYVAEMLARTSETLRSFTHQKSDK